MSITVGRLHKILSALIANGDARKPVCVSKETFKHPLEPDGCTILDVEGASVQWVSMMDGDGFTEYRKDGTEKGRWCVVIDGGYADPVGKPFTDSRESDPEGRDNAHGQGDEDDSQ